MMKNNKKESVSVEKKEKKEKVIAEKIEAEIVGAESVTTKAKFNIPKKVIAAVAGVIVVILLVVVIVLCVNKNKDENRMTTKLNDLGVTFYEDFYYKSAGSGDEDARKTFLARFTDIGIKVSLDNLLRYYVTTDAYKELDEALKDGEVAEKVQDLEKKWFKTDKYECDASETKVKIFPKDPYGEKDYKIEVVTKCGFDSEKTTEKAE